MGKWLTPYTAELLRIGFFSNRYQISFNGDPIAVICCSDSFIEYFIGMLNGAYNLGKLSEVIP